MKNKYEVNYFLWTCVVIKTIQLICLLFLSLKLSVVQVLPEMVITVIFCKDFHLSLSIHAFSDCLQLSFSRWQFPLKVELLSRCHINHLRKIRWTSLAIYLSNLLYCTYYFNKRGVYNFGRIAEMSRLPWTFCTFSVSCWLSVRRLLSFFNLFFSINK